MQPNGEQARGRAFGARGRRERAGVARGARGQRWRKRARFLCCHIHDDLHRIKTGTIMHLQK